MKERTGRKKKRSIRRTLLAAFMVPVVLMVVLGVVSYQTASSGIITKYKESAVSTVAAVGVYCELICDSVENKALELVSNSDLGEYYNKYYKKDNSEALEILRNAKTLIKNAKATNTYVHSVSVIPESGSYVTTLTGSMSANPAEDFRQTAEGSFFETNHTRMNAWMGYHSYLDEHLGIEEQEYALTFYQKLAKSESYLIMDIGMEVTLNMLAQMDFGAGSVKALISADGREIAYVQTEDVTERVLAEKSWFVGTEFYEATRGATEIGTHEVSIDGDVYVYLYTPVGKTGAMICALIPKANLLGQVGSIKDITLIMVICAVLAALGIGTVISTGISKTVRQIGNNLTVVSEGDFSRDFQTKRKDEFRELTGSLNDMIRNVCRLMQNMKQFGTKVNALSGTVSEQTGGINASMQDIARAMEQVAIGVQDQAVDTEKSNENMLSFTQSIGLVTLEAEQMEQTADKAIDVVEQGIGIVQELSEKTDTTVSLTKVLVKDIEEVQRNSEEIKSVVNVIHDIAEQTNLLSLNASIEAARVGVEGRGFAVVAEEIRTLADQSKKSGEKIRVMVELIGATADKTTKSAWETENMVNEQAKALAETVDMFHQIQTCVRAMVEGIHVVTERVAEGMEGKGNVEASLQNISAVSQEVAASTQEVTDTLGEQVAVMQDLKLKVEELRAEAIELDKSMDKFRLE